MSGYTESGLLRAETCHELFERVMGAARERGVHDIEISLHADNDTLTRFAGNVIHQNMAEITRTLSVRPQIDGRTARAATNVFDDDSIARVVEEAIAATRAAAPDPYLPALAEPFPVAPVDRWDRATAECTPAQRAEAAVAAIDRSRSAGHTAAGVVSTGESVQAVLNSNGAFVYHAETMAGFSMTSMAADSSGWAKAFSVDLGSLAVDELAASAVEKAVRSAGPIEVEPGRYTVILEPAAVIDLLGQMFGGFSATAVDDHNSFLDGRVGSRLFGGNIDIVDDVYHPLQSGAPFDGEGIPRSRLRLVESGVPTELPVSRRTGGKTGAAPTGHGLPLPSDQGEIPLNVVIAGGGTSVEQMVASARRAILVTRAWYIRGVDPYRQIYTGMTRDGTFLVENGEIVGGIRNMRFNQSMIDLLSSVEALSPAIRASGEESLDMVVPAMMAGDFRFTEVTRF